MTAVAEDINGDSKLGAVLETWPQLERVLLELSPRFRALQNALVRRTLGRVATLRQVAVAGGVALPTLIARLRVAAGLPPPRAPEPERGMPESPPPWAKQERVTRRRDARQDVAAGVHPLPLVMQELEALGTEDVYELITPFVPAPLIDLARTKGYESYPAGDTRDASVRTLFRRAPVR